MRKMLMLAPACLAVSLVWATTAAKGEEKSAIVATDVYDATLGYPLLATVNTRGETKGRPPQTKTEVRLRRTKTDLVIEWDCEEPAMDKVTCRECPDDDNDMGLENGVECYLNPSDDGKTFYRLVLTSKGGLFDAKCVYDGLRAEGDGKWDSHAKRFVERTEKGWKARLEIPLASLPGIKERFRANFGRNRRTEDVSECVQTSKYADGNCDFANYGTVIVPPEPDLTVKFLETEAKSDPAAFRRLGAVSPNGEMSPFVFKGKLYRMELSDPTRALNISDPRICCEIREAATGKLVSSFAHGRCYYAAAYVENDRVYVTGTEMVSDGKGGKTTRSGRILCFESTDLVNWTERLLFERPGFGYFNTTLTKGPDGYVLALESDTKPQCGEKFTMFFATSKDLKTWTRLDDSLAFPQKWYCGGPFLVYRNGWYYLSLVTALPCARYGQYLYRTRDFHAWEVGRWNPFLLAHPDDRKISPNAHSLDAGRRAEIAKAFVCSAADLEMCDFEGKTYMVYGIGGQHGFYYFAEAWYDGTLADFLESHFK